MEEGLIKVTPNKEKAKSMLKMVDTTLEMIENIDMAKFPSNVTKEYYDVVRELLSVVLLLDGYKTYGEGSHKKLIDYLKANHKEFGGFEISLIDDLRTVRNRIAYDGFFVEKDYIKRKLNSINGIISTLKSIISMKLQED